MLEQLEDRLTPAASPFAASAGGLLADSGQGIGADAAGNVYIAGNIQGMVNAIDTDAYVAKYNASGAPQWHKVWSGDDGNGNSYGDSANAIAVDGAGNSYVAGDFRATVNFGNGIVLTSTGAIDGFVAKLDTDGNVLWAHQFASNGNFGPNLYDRLGTLAPKSIAVDHSGNVVVTGIFSGHMDMDPANPGQHFLDYPNVHAGGYVVKLDANGKFLWEAQAVNPPDNINANAVAVDTHDNVYVLGNFGNFNYFNDKTAKNSDQQTPNALTLTGPNITNLYVWKLNADGTNAWVSQMDSQDYNTAVWGLGIAVDTHGAIYTTGSFNGTNLDFDPTVSHAGTPPPDVITSANGNYDTFIDKMDSTGHWLWVRQITSTADNWGTGLALDRAGNAYVTGYISGDAMFGNQLLTHVSPAGNSFITELDPAGNFLCAHKSTDLSGAAPAGDKAAAIAVDNQGYVDITGAFAPRMQWPGLSPLTSVGGSSDIFVVKTKLECSPTHATAVDGHILQIVGDNQANRIALTDDAHGNIVVTLDDDAARMFHGIDRIEVSTFGGNDVVRYNGGSPTAIWDPDGQPADLVVNLGANDDMFTLDAYGPQHHDSPVAGWMFDVDAGEGTDTVNVETEGAVAVLMTANLGGGNDVFTYDAHEVQNMGARSELTVNGEAGDDDIRVTHDFNLLPEASSEIQPPITVNMNGGKGHNQLVNEWLFNALPGSPGDPPFNFNIALTSNLNGGDSADINDIYAFNPQPEPPGFPGMSINAPITANLDPRLGINTMNFEFFREATPALAFPYSVYLNSALHVSMIGGDGRDTMNLVIGSPHLIWVTDLGSVDTYQQGWGGDDSIRADLFFDTRSTGHVHARQYGGDGKDDLTMNIYGIDDVFLMALIDGRADFDTAHHTANVMVQHCELDLLNP